MNKVKAVGIGGVVAAVLAGCLWIRLWCRHKYSGPFYRKTEGKKAAYVICYKCSREFDFDSTTRKVGKERKSS